MGCHVRLWVITKFMFKHLILKHYRSLARILDFLKQRMVTRLYFGSLARYLHNGWSPKYALDRWHVIRSLKNSDGHYNIQALDIFTKPKGKGKDNAWEYI